MVYRLLSIFFKTDYDYQRYTPKHWHLSYALLVMAIGVTTFVRDGWETFGTVTFVLGALLGLVIIIGIAWDKAIEYWSTLDSFAITMMRANNPDLWAAMGFKQVPQNVTITEMSNNNGEAFPQWKMKRLPISPPVMQMIADKVLLSGKTDFIEAEYTNVPNIRKVRNQLKKDGLIAQKNNKNVRMGYTFNRKGVQALYEYASEGIKIELKRRENES